MRVPFIDLKRFEPGFLEEWHDKVVELSKNAAFVGGAEVDELERGLARECGAEHVVSCANGTDALQLLLRALGAEGGVVLLPDVTFWATFEAVVNTGGRPVTVDIADDLQMDFDLFKRAVDLHKPKAAILAHLYGWGSARLDEYRAFCRERKLPLIEDGAQCLGATWRGKPAFQGALAATMSFYPAKVLGAAGDAGAVATSDKALAERVRCLANHGRELHYAHGLSGWNSRMDSLQAAWLNLALRRLPKRLASRRAVLQRYAESLPSLVRPPEGWESNGYLAVTLHDPAQRDKLGDKLKEQEIGFGVTYPCAVSAQKGARDALAGRVGGDAADRFCRSVLNPPLFPWMTDAEVAEVLRVLEP